MRALYTRLKYLAVTLWTIFVVGPFLWALSTSFKDFNSVTSGAKYIPWLQFEPSTEGWAVLDLTGDALINAVDNDRELTGDNGTVLSGLPATGFAVVEYNNGDIGGAAVANYQMSWEHKTAISSSSAN